MASGYKDFTAGSTLAAADLEDYCELQSVMRFATAAARDTALASVLTEGLMAYTIDANLFWWYTGAAWVPFGKQILQVVNTQTGAVATGTTILPGDNTIPQNTEGDQYMTLAITPLSASSYLLITVNIQLAQSSGAAYLQAALFVDSTANALAASLQTFPSAGYMYSISFNHYVASGSTTARTYKVRGGGSAAGTTTFNGVSGGQIYGGVMASSITITEIAP